VVAAGGPDVTPATITVTSLAFDGSSQSTAHRIQVTDISTTISFSVSYTGTLGSFYYLKTTNGTLTSNSAFTDVNKVAIASSPTTITNISNNDYIYFIVTRTPRGATTSRTVTLTNTSDSNTVVLNAYLMSSG
jgi:hypothetical protein